MLSKYEDFFKISKSQECSLYVAVSRQTGQPVLLKRFKNKLTWDEVLKSRNMQYSQKAKMFPKMIEIFKNKGDFYVVYERPSGPSLLNPEQTAPVSLDNFYLLFNDLCQHLSTLKQMVPGLYVLPEWIFLHRHTVKILHFQPFFVSRSALSSDHVYLYKVENQILPTENDDQQSSSIVPSDKKRNVIFNLGMISYYLLTAHKHPQPETEDEYLTLAHDIAENSEKRVLKVTRDKQLASMVSKMLSSNLFQLPDLQRIKNFMFVKAAEVTPKKKHQHQNCIEIDIEHIKLDQGKKQDEVDTRKKLRTCCADKESSLEKINAEIRMSKELRQHKDVKGDHDRKMHGWLNGKETTRNAVSSKKSFLPTIKKGGSQRQKTAVDLMNTTNSKPMMFSHNPDSTSRLQLQRMDNRKTACLYHPTEVITNFCRQKTCLMPLCPTCIREHSQYHLEASIKPQYFNIQETIDDVHSLLFNSIHNLEQDKKRNADIIRKVQNMEAVIKDKLSSAKRYIFQLLDQAFTDLEGELQDKLQRVNSEQGLHSLQKAEKINQKLTISLSQLYSLRQGLKTDKLMGSTIIFLKDKQPEASSLHNSLSSYLDSNESYTPKIQFNNQAKNQIMCSLSRLIRVEGRKENASRHKDRPSQSRTIFKNRISVKENSNKIIKEKSYTPEKSTNYCKSSLEQAKNTSYLHNNSPYRDRLSHTLKPSQIINSQTTPESYRGKDYTPDYETKYRRNNARKEIEPVYRYME